MNEELNQGFATGLFTLVTFIYWINLFVWVFVGASESSKKEADTSGGAFVVAFLIYAFVAYHLWLLTAYLVDENYAWVNLIIFIVHMYWAYGRNGK